MVSIFYLVPLILRYFIAVVLAVIPKTYLLGCIVAYYRPVSRTLGGIPGNHDQRFMNAVYIFVMVSVARTLGWTLAKEPLVRHANREKASFQPTITDGIGLAVTLRGIGWDWVHGIPTPHETRPTDCCAFRFCAFRFVIIHVLLSGVIRVVIGSFLPMDIAENGSFIVGATLPLLKRYLRAGTLSYVFGRTGYACGTFLSAPLQSGVMVVLNADLELWQSVTGFGMMVLVVLAEITLERRTGQKVESVAGWAWTLFWMTVWGNVIMDGFAWAGMFGCLTFTERAVPGKDVLVGFVTGFDTCLHAV